MILASASPRRREILSAHGHHFEVISADIDEHLDAQTSLFDLTFLLQNLALAKAHAVIDLLGDKAIPPPDEKLLIIAADTVVYADTLLGKPQNHDEAVQMLLRLKNRWHSVLTAVAVVEVAGATGAAGAGGAAGATAATAAPGVALTQQTSFTDLARVRFKDYNLAEIEAYIQTEPPFDKAGSYAIQGIWKKQVAEVRGDIETVIGLPYQRLARLLGWQ